MIGIDIGGTNLLIGIVENGTVLKRHHEEICAKGDFERVAKQVCTAVKSIAPANDDPIGVSVAGSVNIEEGIVLRAQNLDWNNAPLQKYIQDELNCPVIIENDVTSAAWGEFIYGAGRNYNSMFAVWIGTGIGGGLILDKKIWRGPLGTGGEFGMGISNQNPQSEYRTLESMASRSGFKKLQDNSSITTNDLIQAFTEPTNELCKLLRQGACRIGTSVANVITLLSLETVVFGGGITEALGEKYLKLIRSQFEQDVFPEHCKKCTFEITVLGPDAGILGAAHLASQT